jgi:hypothetical protein
MKKLLILLPALVVACFTFNSCVKDAKVPDPGFNVVETGANATQIIEAPLDIYLQADRAIRFQRDSIIAKDVRIQTLTIKIGYISVTVSPADTLTYPKKVTVDFGSDTTKTYTGKMIIMMSGDMRTAGSNCAITYSNLITGKSLITGNDSIISFGTKMNTDGTYSIISHYNTHGGHLTGLGNKLITYDGRMFGKFDISTRTSHIDSLALVATDGNGWLYKINTIGTFYPNLAPTCNYFNSGEIKVDILINNVLTGWLGLDYGYIDPNSGTAQYACDNLGAIYTGSYINKSYTTQFYQFIAKNFN